MKKIVILLLLLSFILTSCQLKEPLQSYNEAVKRTNEVNQGQYSIAIEATSDFKEDQVIEDVEHILFEMYGKYDLTDKEKEQIEAHSYMYLGEMGMDFSYYLMDGTNFIKIPFEEDYIIVNDEVIVEKPENFEEPINFEEIFRPIMTKWLSLLQEENVIRGDKTILSTEDGDVKATKYTVQLNQEQLKSMISEFVTVIENNSELMMSLMGSYVETDMTETSFIQLIKDIEEELLKTEMSMIMTSYIDADGFIIDTSVEYTIHYNNYVDPFEKQVIMINMKNWDIYQEQAFDFPNLTEENSMIMDGLMNESELPKGW